MPNTPLQYMLFLLLLASAGCRDSPAPSPQIDKSASSGDRLMSQGRYGEALQAYRRAAKRRPEAAEIQRKLAAAYAKNEHLAQAVTAYEKAIDLDPDHAKARTKLAILFTRLDRYEEAFAMLEETIELRPDYAWAHLVLGCCISAKAATGKPAVPTRVPSPPRPTTGKHGSTWVKSISNRTISPLPKRPTQRAMTSEEKFVFDLEGCLSIDASWPRPPYATIPK